MKWSLFIACIAIPIVSGCMPATVVPDEDFVIDGMKHAVMEVVADVIRTDPGSEGFGSTDFFTGFGRDPIRWSLDYDESAGLVKASTTFRVCLRPYQCSNSLSWVRVNVEDIGGGRSSVTIQWRRDTRTAYPLAERIYSTLVTTFGRHARRNANALPEQARTPVTPTQHPSMSAQPLSENGLLASIPEANPNRLEIVVIVAKCNRVGEAFRQDCHREQLEGLAYLQSPPSGMSPDVWQDLRAQCDTMGGLDDYRVQADCVRQASSSYQENVASQEMR